MCTVAEELNLLDLAPLLHDDFLWLKAKKIPLYLYSTTAVSALRQWLHLKMLWFLESLWLELLEFGENCGRVKHETITNLKEK